MQEQCAVCLNGQYSKRFTFCEFLFLAIVAKINRSQNLTGLQYLILMVSVFPSICEKLLPFSSDPYYQSTYVMFTFKLILIGYIMYFRKK